MLDWLRRKESKKYYTQLLCDPIVAFTPILENFAVRLAYMRKFLSADECETVRMYFKVWVDKFIEDSNQDGEELYWLTFESGHKSRKMLDSNKKSDVLEAIGIDLARCYAKGIIHLSNHSEPLDLSDGSNIVRTLEDWEEGTDLVELAFSTFGRNPAGGGILALNAYVEEAPYR